MNLSPRERAMLREMGVAWPQAPQRVQPAVAAAAAAKVATGPLHKDVGEGPAEAASVKQPVTPPAVASAWPPNATWDALQAAVSSCKRCGLCETRRRTVFGVGHPGAQWMVVGEAPGEQEDRQGEPFVGAAGQLLDRMLGSIGLGRATEPTDDPSARGVRSAGRSGHAAHQVFITNTVKCRPPQNRNPEPAELAACEPVLHRQMELVQPRLVLAMGRFAAQQLLRTEEPIGRLRGRVHRLTGEGAQWAGAQGVPVVVTYHPAYLLRNPIDKAKAWDDLCLALDTMDALRVDER